MKLCLNMIVKNEAARIERCLASVAPYLSSWCIIDTGSTDDTKKVVLDFFANRKIRGVWRETEFVNFGDTRNYALERARIAHLGADYFLLVDADMELVVDDPAWAEKLSAPAYKLAQKNGDLFYWNVRLLRCDQRSARYIGVTHEYLSTEGDSPTLAGAWFLDHGDGSNRKGKFKRDADLLRADVAEKARSFYYLAQSLRDMGEKRDAADAYGICAKIARWDEERWSAELNRARCLRDLGAPEWVDVALHAFGQRPARSEPLYDLAKHFREQGLNEVSLLFSFVGISKEKPADLLFIEDAVYRWGMWEEYAICAYYSDVHRDRGRRICNELALDRSAPAHVRETARRNLFFYAQPLDELCPSFAPWRKLDSPTDWSALNPSIARLGGTLYAVLRTVNYTIDEAGRYVMPSGEAAIRTHNYLVAIEPDGSHRLDHDIAIDLGTPLYDQVLGLEDMRLFEYGRQLCYIAATRETNAQGWAEQGWGQIEGRGRHALIQPLGQERRNEKNWLPIVEKFGEPIRFLYSCDPTRVLSSFGETVSETVPPFACENFRGGSQLVPFSGGYLCLIHEAIQSPLDEKRCYQHRFVWFHKDMTLEKISLRFWLQANNQIEFVAGLCWHPDEERLIISYGIRDAEAWLGTIDANEVCRLLGMEPLAARKALPQTQMTLVSYSWALGQTNRPLRTHAEIDVALAHLRNLKLPLHPDHPKNWDNLIAIAHATATTEKQACIVDAGGTRESAFLPALRFLGYEHLTCWNTAFVAKRWEDRVFYAPADMTHVDVPPATIKFVACLSVIEHGVDVRAFLREMARVIKPGGHLFLSFDYWHETIDCGDRVAFGAPVRIFTPSDVQDILFYAGDQGLLPTAVVEYDCQDRVVEWLGLRYTFMNLLLRRG